MGRYHTYKEFSERQEKITNGMYPDQGCYIEGYAVKQDFVVSFQSENRVHGVIKPPCNTRTLIFVSMIPVESNVIKTRRL